MENYLSTIIQELAEKIEKEKQTLLIQRIEERVGECVDFFKESQKRFPRIAREHHTIDQSEHWYWNDGSDSGLHLISFFQNFEQNIMPNDGKFNIGFKYY